MGSEIPRTASISSWFRSIEWPSWPPKPLRVRGEVVLALVVSAAVGFVVILATVRAVSDDFDRDAAITRTVDANAGRLTRDQAECYVDGVHDQLGGRYLAVGADPPDEVRDRMTAIRVDCVGIAALGATTTVDPAAAGPPSTEAGNLPRKPGDNPVLDQLYLACQSGSGGACDQLFDQSPVGSAYEAFALSCGGRTVERRCADVYVLP